MQDKFHVAKNNRGNLQGTKKLKLERLKISENVRVDDIIRKVCRAGNKGAFQEAANDQRQIPQANDIPSGNSRIEMKRISSVKVETRSRIERHAATCFFEKQGENTLDGSNILFEKLNEY